MGPGFESQRDHRLTNQSTRKLTKLIFVGFFVFKAYQKRHLFSYLAGPIRDLPAGVEWIHFGTADQIKFDVIQNLIGTFLSDDQIILVP